MEASDAHWFHPSPASNSGPAARAFHAAAALGTTLFAHGGHVYVKEKKGLHKFDDLWALETVGGQSLGLSPHPGVDACTSRTSRGCVKCSTTCGRWRRWVTTPHHSSTA